jgi:queuosine precursor transporter
LTEVYGYAQARRVIWLGFGCNLLAVAAIWVGQVLPAASVWDAQFAYERILGSTPRLLDASFVAYLVGEFANAAVLAKMKVTQWLAKVTYEAAVTPLTYRIVARLKQIEGLDPFDRDTALNPALTT